MLQCSRLTIPDSGDDTMIAVIERSWAWRKVELVSEGESSSVVRLLLSRLCGGRYCNVADNDNMRTFVIWSVNSSNARKSSSSRVRSAHIDITSDT